MQGKVLFLLQRMRAFQGGIDLGPEKEDEVGEFNQVQR
jgi:hypothetical protein